MNIQQIGVISIPTSFDLQIIKSQRSVIKMKPMQQGLLHIRKVDNQIRIRKAIINCGRSSDYLWFCFICVSS